MPFTAKLRFSGLGVAFLHSDDGSSKPSNPTAVELTAIRTPPGMSRHIPRLCLQVRDVLGVKNRSTEVHNMRVDACGEAIQEIDLIGNPFLEILVDPKPDEGEKFTASWEGRTSNPNQASSSLDWLVQLDQDLNIDTQNDLNLPSSSLQHYETILNLPPGELSTERWLYGYGDQRARWYFGSDPDVTPHFPLKEFLVWSRSDLNSLTIRPKGESATWEILLDDNMRQLHSDSSPEVQLSFTNLPEIGSSGRFTKPRHIHHFSEIVQGKPTLPKLQRSSRVGTGASSHGACPPGTCGC